MSNKEIRNYILSLLEGKIKRLGFKEKYLLNDFDLIQSGLLDSMQFLELISDIEEHYKMEIDFDKEEISKLRKLSGLVNIIEITIGRTHGYTPTRNS